MINLHICQDNQLKCYIFRKTFDSFFAYAVKITKIYMLNSFLKVKNNFNFDKTKIPKTNFQLSYEKLFKKSTSEGLT